MSRNREERVKSLFHSLEEAIRWVRERTERLNAMVFHEDLETLEELFEQHKIDNRDIQDFNQTVKECIARQVSYPLQTKSPNFLINLGRNQCGRFRRILRAFGRA